MENFMKQDFNIKEVIRSRIVQATVYKKPSNMTRPYNVFIYMHGCEKIYKFNDGTKIHTKSGDFIFIPPESAPVRKSFHTFCFIRHHPLLNVLEHNEQRRHDNNQSQSSDEHAADGTHTDRNVTVGTYAARKHEREHTEDHRERSHKDRS